MDNAPMHRDATEDTIPCECGCGVRFVQRKSWQRFATAKCRADWNAKRAESAPRGVVSSVRMLRRGGVSITMRFSLEERDRVSKLEPGKVVELLEGEGR